MYAYFFVLLGVMRKEKIMKSMSFKNRDEMVKKLKSIQSEMNAWFAEMDKKVGK